MVCKTSIRLAAQISETDLLRTELLTGNCGQTRPHVLLYLIKYFLSQHVRMLTPLYFIKQMSMYFIIKFGLGKACVSQIKLHLNSNIIQHGSQGYFLIGC